MKKITLLLGMLMVLSFNNHLKAGTDTTNCNFLSNIAAFYTWDTCKGAGFRNSINAQIIFKTPGCYKYAWSVNGTIVGTKSIVNYLITANGTYKFCLKVIDTCNNCDTSVCIVKTINCFAACNWKAKSPSISASDSCQKGGGSVGIKASLNISNRSCLKYSWILNGVVKSSQSNFYSSVPKNGTYLVCVKITDTCKKCDTTICLYKVVNCPLPCNFKGRGLTTGYWDSCKGQNSNINGYISFNNKNCLKYQWKVNGAVVSNNYIFSYPISVDGTYAVCVKVTDTCNNCDTTICSYITTTCFTKKCNWKARVPYMFAWDTCKGTGFRNSVNAYISFSNGYDSCYKYTWTVNGVSAGSKNVMNYPVTKNGTYTICLKIMDTCDKCDTTICVYKTLNCFPSCNFKAKSPYMYAWDTCKGSGGRSSVNAYISMNNSSCLKYMWKVNGVVKTGSNNVFSYPITQNGTYTICVKVTDTCNACDTVFCITRTVNCFTNPCNFKARVPYLSLWDSCSSTKAIIYGNISFYNKTCLKYQWSIAGVTAGNGNYFSYPVTKNGTYTVCVKVTDTCNRCDTTFCVTKIINCKSLGISQETDSRSQLNLYPNPAGNILNIEWSGNASSFEIMDIFGSRVMKGELAEGLNTLNTGALANGIYTIRINTPDGTRTAKVVLNR